MDVKPWEPVGGWWLPSDGSIFHQEGMKWDWYKEACSRITDHPCRVTLANGQRIIVRALSEDRKAARAAMRRKPRPGIPAFGGLK